MNVRAREMAAAIKQETGGRFDLQIFPSSQLGSDTDTLSQLRSGGVEFFTLSGLILSTLVPPASINGMGFAFPNYDTVWKAMDGDLGAYVRGADRQVQARRDGEDLGQRLPADHDFDQADRDARRFQRHEAARAAVAAVDLDVQGARCRRRPRSISTKSIRRCRPRSSTARKIRWRSSPTAKLYEVQKYCSLTNHMWDGFWFLANQRAWEALPDDVRDIVAKNINTAGLKERDDVAELNADAPAGPRRQGPCVQSSPIRRRSATASRRRLLYRMEGQIRRRGLGAFWRNPRANCVTAGEPMPQTDFADESGSCALLGCALDACARRVRRNSGGALVASRSLILFAGVVSRYVLRPPAGLVGRTGLDPVPVARDARRGRRVSPRRAYAHDGVRCQSAAPIWRASLDTFATAAALAFLR